MELRFSNYSNSACHYVLLNGTVNEDIFWKDFENSFGRIHHLRQSDLNIIKMYLIEKDMVHLELEE
jgi:hypothetical protein